MSELATQGSKERNEVIAKLRGLTEEQQYELWEEMWEERHRRTFFTVKPIVNEQEAPPAPAAPPPLPPSTAVLTEADLKSEMALAEERPLPFLRLRKPLGEMPKGIEYVVGTPPASPVLRPLKQTLFDKLIVPESGSLQRVDLFTDCRWFPDHTAKTEKDTNMNMDGQLGFPLEFDLSWIDLKFEKFSHPDDVRRVLRGLVFKWIRGQSVPWLRVTLSGFEPVLLVEGQGSDEMRKQVEEFRRSVADMKDGVWTRYRVGVLTPDGKPQRITGPEAFRVEVSSPGGGIGELRGPVHLKVLLGDQLYAQL